MARKVRLPPSEEPIEETPQPKPELKEFLSTQDKSTLINVLAELAEANEPVRQRLERLQLSTEPRKLAAAFKRIRSAWRRSTKSIDYRAGRAFAAKLLEWLDQVERGLVPVDPVRALDLIEGLIECDGSFIERADDSDGSIGDVLRMACERWLQTAKQIDNSDIDWVERIYALAKADDYGVREALLSEANTLLDEASLRVLAGRFDSDFGRTLAYDCSLKPKRCSAAIPTLPIIAVAFFFVAVVRLRIFARSANCCLVPNTTRQIRPRATKHGRTPIQLMQPRCCLRLAMRPARPIF